MSYNVYRGTTAGGETLYSNVGGNGFTDSSATSGTTYFYKVTAVNSAGESGLSSEVSAASTTNTTGLTLTATPGFAQVTLNWNAYPNAAYYQVFRGTTVGGEDKTTPFFNANGTTYTDTGLKNGTAYFYYIVCITNDNVQHQSNEIIVTPGTTVAAPAAPTGLAATAGNAQVSLTWNASTGATSYNVYRGTAAGGESATAIATGVTGTSYTNTGLTNGTAYYFTVKAVNAGGTSGASNEANATPTAAPAAPTGLSATAGNAQVSLTWNASTGATSYNVYRGTAAGGESATAIATGISGTSYTNTGLTNGTAYYFTVKAVNAAVPPALPMRPMQPRPAAPGSSGWTYGHAGNAQVSLTWNASTGATSYNVYRGTAAGGESATAIATGISGTSYTNTGLTNGTAYYYTVKAVNAGGTSGASNEANATPTVAARRQRRLDFRPPRGNAQVSLTWNASTGATSYNVYRGTAAGGESATAIATGVTGTSYTNTGLTNGTAYYYTVKAVNAGGTSGASNEANATPVASTGPITLSGGATNHVVSLSWTSTLTGTAYWEVFRGTTPGGEGSTPLDYPSGTTWTDNFSPVAGTKYYYVVRQVDTSNNLSAPSNEVTVTP